MNNSSVGPAHIAIGLAVIGGVSAFLPWIDARIVTVDGMSLPQGYVALGGALGLLLVGVRGLRVTFARSAGAVMAGFGALLLFGASWHLVRMLDGTTSPFAAVRAGHGAYIAGIAGLCAVVGGLAVMVRGDRLG